MLGEYIDQYVDAYKKNDRKAMEKIEKDLSKVGMDKYTLMQIVKEKVADER